MVTLVHGLRGLVADVYLDGQVALEGFDPERTTEPLPIPAGAHDVAVRQADQPADAEPQVAGTLNVTPGSNLSAVVHLTAVGAPTMSVYDNNTAATLPPGTSRVVVRHTAAAPAVDVLVGQAPLVTGLVNPNEGGGEVPAGLAALTVNSTGNQRTIVPATEIEVPDGTAMFLYLIGSTRNDNVGWLAQTVSGVGTTPAAVPTGTDGLAAPDPMPLAPLVVATLTGLAAIAVLATPRVRAHRAKG